MTTAVTYNLLNATEFRLLGLSLDVARGHSLTRLFM